MKELITVLFVESSQSSSTPKALWVVKKQTCRGPYFILHWNQGEERTTFFFFMTSPFFVAPPYVSLKCYSKYFLRNLANDSKNKIINYMDCSPLVNFFQPWKTQSKCVTSLCQMQNMNQSVDFRAMAMVRLTYMY